MRIIKDEKFDAEREFYGSSGITAINCSFDGPADGESAFKESSDIHCTDCCFNLRYPFWHDNGIEIIHCRMTELCRAAMWYSKDIYISDSELNGIKALRECRNAVIESCNIISPEFGWSVTGINAVDSKISGEYIFLRSSDMKFTNVDFSGKYSFQYSENAVFENCRFDTKDAFWHGKNITVRNSIINSEYLGWYSENLVLENCEIYGTQPFCYCRDLKLTDCIMTGTDLCFEKSSVNAVITSPVISIKNPESGCISVPQVGEIIRDDPDSKAEIIVCGGLR